MMRRQFFYKMFCYILNCGKRDGPKNKQTIPEQVSKENISDAKKKDNDSLGVCFSVCIDLRIIRYSNNIYYGRFLGKLYLLK